MVMMVVSGVHGLRGLQPYAISSHISTVLLHMKLTCSHIQRQSSEKALFLFPGIPIVDLY